MKTLISFVTTNKRRKGHDKDNILLLLSYYLLTKLLKLEIQRQMDLSTVLLDLGVTDMNTGNFREIFRPDII